MTSTDLHTLERRLLAALQSATSTASARELHTLPDADFRLRGLTTMAEHLNNLLRDFCNTDSSGG